MSLFALVAAATGALAMGSMVRTIENRHGTAAVMLAQQELERLRGLPYADIVGGSDAYTAEGQAYTVTTGVQLDAPAAGMKLITVTVDWTGPEGAKYYETQTIYTSING